MGHSEMRELKASLQSISRCLSEGNLALACKALEQTLVLTPNNAQLTFAYGNTLQRMGDMEAASRNFYKAIQLAPDYQDAHIGLINSLLALGRIAQARAALKRAVEINGESAELFALMKSLDPGYTGRHSRHVSKENWPTDLAPNHDVPPCHANQAESHVNPLAVNPFASQDNLRSMIAAAVKPEFYLRIVAELLSNLTNSFGADNWDELRYGPYSQNSPNNNDSDFTNFFQKSITRFERLYDLLADEYSKFLLIKIIAYRILGFKKVKLPLSYGLSRQANALFTKSLIKSDSFIRIRFNNWQLRHFSFYELGLPMECYSLCPDANKLRQYEYDKYQPPVMVMEGDYVIDAGACWGDTALRFACKAGENGRVFSFEFEPENMAVFSKNLALNPRLANRITLTPMALSSSTGDTVHFNMAGPGTRISNTWNNSPSVPTITIDDFVKQQSIENIDFIKMDIEGSELNSLKGSEGVLRRFMPKLAICLYHNPTDFVTIPEYLYSLDLPYEFFLDHITIHGEETVLFAKPK